MRQSNNPKKLTKKEIALLSKKLGIDFSLIPKNHNVNFYQYSDNPDNYFLQNVMREDIVTNESGEYTKAILDDAPYTEDNYFKFKQIL